MIALITFEPLWETLRRRSISTYDLEYEYELNPAEISRLKHDHNFTLRSVDKFCKLFGCRVEEVIRYIDR